MPNPPKRLGRGIGSLISLDRPDVAPAVEKPGAPARPSTGAAAGVSELAIDRIKANPYQPRTPGSEEDIADLVASVCQSGIIQPIVVRAKGKQWEVIAGERRLRAAQLAGLETVPAIAREATDEQMLEWALIENIHREDLNAIDRARAYDRYAREFRLSVEEVAQRVGESRSNVANYLRLLDLEEEIQQMVSAGRLSMGHARCLLGFADREGERLRLATATAEHDLSVRALEEIVRRRREKKGEGKVVEAAPPRPQVRHLEEQWAERLGTKVRIREGRKPNTGRITIDYYSLDDFTRLSRLLGVEDDVLPG